MSNHHPILVVGGGTAGLTVAARLRKASLPVAVIEPSSIHYYQPLWTLVGGGVFPREASVRPQQDVIPDGVTWIRDRVVALEPDRNAVRLESGAELTYDQLVVAAGIQLDWHKIEGLAGNVGKNGICSNYSYETVASTWEFVKNFRGGTALFTFPSTPVKCAGAPQKVMYLADDHFRRAGVRDRSRVRFVSAGGAIFGVPRYRAALEKVVARKGIETTFHHDLVAVRPNEKKAIFRNLQDGSEVALDYDLLHVTPPQSAPDFIKKSPLANAAGWVEVDKHTMQHVRYPNVFSLGDCSSLPTSKTAAAIRKQAPLLVQNLLAFRQGRPLEGRYDGYASCPLVTGYGKLILAEFDYDGIPRESFPFDQAQERYSMYALKAYALPELYWNGMLKGNA